MFCLQNHTIPLASAWSVTSDSKPWGDIPHNARLVSVAKEFEEEVGEDAQNSTYEELSNVRHLSNIGFLEHWQGWRKMAPWGFFFFPEKRPRKIELCLWTLQIDIFFRLFGTYKPQGIPTTQKKPSPTSPIFELAGTWFSGHRAVSTGTRCLAMHCNICRCGRSTTVIKSVGSSKVNSWTM